MDVGAVFVCFLELVSRALEFCLEEGDAGEGFGEGHFECRVSSDQ